MKGSSIILNHISITMQEIDLLKDISFTLQPGEHLAITGSSGSGKTTLAKVLAGQLFAQGNITINWDESSLLRKKVLLVEQRNQFKNLSRTSDFYYQQRFNSFDAGDAQTVWQALICFESIDIEEKSQSLLKNFGLDKLKDAPLIQLSSGENKRFQLTKAILAQPQILILDSPFTGLDTAARKYLNTVLNELAETGTKIIIVTDVHQLPDCITHVAVLEDKKIKNLVAREDLIESTNSYSAKHEFIDTSSLQIAEEQNHYRYIINMQNVHVQYGDKVILNNINWQVKQGEKWLLKGHNGAGKSTLLSLINGDNPQAYKNEIYLFNERRGSGESIWDIKSKIGFVSPELHAFYDKQTSCFNTIASGFFDTVGLFKKISLQQQEQVHTWIDILGCKRFNIEHLPHYHSACSEWFYLPELWLKSGTFILDEPCQGLDDEQKNIFIRLVNDLSERFNKTLIYVSHYDNEIPDCITNVLELVAGKQTMHLLKKQTEFA